MENKNLFTAIILILFGSLILARNFGQIHFPVDWRLVMVIFALVNVLKVNLGAAVFWTLLSIYFYVPSQEAIKVFQFWPLILVGFGLKKILTVAKSA